MGLSRDTREPLNDVAGDNGEEALRVISFENRALDLSKVVSHNDEKHLYEARHMSVCGSLFQAGFVQIGRG